MKTLIKDLKKVLASDIEDKDKYCEKLINGFLRERENEQLLVGYEKGWISTKDRLPELINESGSLEEKWGSSNYVLVAYRRERIYHSDSVYEIAKFEKGKNFQQWYSPSYDDQISDPDFWMPLPEPPK